MRNMQLILAVEDEQYIEPFLLYARTGEFAKQIGVRAFSKVEPFLEAMRRERPDFVLGEPAFLKPWLTEDGRRGVPWAALGGGEDSISLGGPVLLPFQPLNLLLTAVLDLAGSSAPQTAGASAGAEVVAVYSAAGGAGKTTVALNLAKQLGSRGVRVFYLSLETLDSSASFREGSGGAAAGESGLAELLYDLRAAREKGEPCRTPFSRCAPFKETIKASAFPALENPDELLEMNGQDTKELIDHIARSGMFDSVIVDTDTQWHERTETLLERADRVIWLLADDLLHLNKTAAWIADRRRRTSEPLYALLAKTTFVVNRYGGRLENALPGSELKPAGFLSYIPSWKYLSREDVLLGSPIFQRDILTLCEQMELGRR
ncbi:ParA family protein [Saccharibacillus sp. CPCC 101409]|uniref:nucleotide-binding protein n=1 Tax=Saccharibacillus sp. CPCC 101409 TaxID=3058041 RepID=UPI002670E983|nr:ParA family protein [Saccharibacillus sp. CPCC 101409]MDO3408630.1 ParA family protein [Saccharibacillus sp. CPCC 101409]